MTTTPTPGLHDMSFEDYLAIPAASKSNLWEMRQFCPLKAKAKLDGLVEKDTSALRLGRITHMCVLEHETFLSTYIRGPDSPLNRNPGRAAWTECKKRYGEDAVTGAEYDTAMAIREAVRAIPKAKRLLEGQAERTMIWHDPETGVLCKGRPDLISEHVSALVDLKTARDASEEGFGKAVGNMGYHVQAAHYLMGAQECGAPREHFAFLAVEKVVPFAGAIYELTPESAEAGVLELRVLLRQWKWCEENDLWPGYGRRWNGHEFLAPQVTKLSLPPWIINEAKARGGEG